MSNVRDSSLSVVGQKTNLEREHVDVEAHLYSLKYIEMSIITQITILPMISYLSVRRTTSY
jgi:hypothetical protein